ncbi:MAG: pilus assembly protein PilM, partial [Candidatus Poribacteria bacterium]|nr:pilus assembly protein PilM [Candidatus Poribacteria bacterium]
MAKNQVVSIDIGTDAIKMVQLEKTTDGIRLIDAGIESYPNRQKETAAPPENAINNLKESLLTVWKKVGGKYPVVVSVPRLLITTRRLSNLPQTNEDEQLTSVVAMQAETELPFRPEDAVYDFHDIRQTESGVSVEIVAAKRDAVQELIDCLKPLNVTPNFM